MFAAAREKLLGAWRKLREGSLAKLFVFEFVVVMLGVLAAQWVADWARERDAMKEMEVARLEAERTASRSLMVALGYRRLLPCLEDQMRSVMRAANGDGEVDPKRLVRPSMRIMPSYQLDNATMTRVERRYGTEYIQFLEVMSSQALTLEARMDLVQQAWRSFALLDPRNGTPSATDYIEARLAAAEILTHLRGIEINVGNVIDYGERFDVNPVENLDGRYANDCDEMWESGEMFIRL